MASKEHKIVRKAQAMSELSRLSGLLAKHLGIEVPDVQARNRDSELEEIQRIEGINGLLTQVLETGKPAEVKKPASKKHGANK